MPRVGNKRKKTRTHQQEDEGDKVQKTTPRCFVMKRGTVGQFVGDLVMDFRDVMSPNCAKNLRESRTNRIADFTAVSAQLGISHLCLFSTTKMGTYLRVARLPQGPTLTFKVLHFSLARDVRASQKRPHNANQDFVKAPLQVLNGFSGQGGKKSAEQTLMYEMLSGLFPPLDVANFRHSECRRVALFNHDRTSGIIQFRHYSIVRKTAGVQRGVSKLLRTGRISSMGKLEDISDFVFSGGGAASDSEMEDAVDVPSLDMNSSSIAIKLREIGPRMELQLIKGEEGLLNGMVLFHRYLTKTPTEQEVLAKKARERKKLKDRNEKIEKAVESMNKKKKKSKEKAREQARKDRNADDDFGDPDDMKPKGSGKGAEKRNRSAKSFWGKRKSESDKGKTMKEKVMDRYKSAMENNAKKSRKD